MCFGLERIVHRRVLPCHYGIELGVPYNPSIQDSQYNYTQQWTRQTYNSDTVEWFAKMVRDPARWAPSVLTTDDW